MDAEPSSSHRLAAFAATAFTLVAIAAVGQALFFGPYLLATLAPLAGLLAALGVRRWPEAAGAAFIGTLGGALLADLVAAPSWAPLGSWLPTVVVAAIFAAAVGALVAYALASSPRLSALMALLSVLLVVGSMWVTVLQRVQGPFSDGRTLLEEIAPGTDSRRITTDESMFALYIRAIREGRPYYATVRDLLVRRNREMAGSVDLYVPMSYRLPTLYALLAALGGSGYSILLATLALMSAAVAAAYALCRRFVGVPLSVFGAVAAASYLAGYANGIRLLDTEFWAGALGLIFAAAFVWSGAEKRGARVWLWVSLAAALLAALVRELGVAFLLVGLLASLAPGAGSRVRRAAPWLGGICIAVTVYALHWRAASAVIATLASPAAAERVSWLQQFGVPLASAAWFAGSFMSMVPAAAIVLFGLGMLGSAIGPVTLRDQLALGLVAVGGSVVSLFLGVSGSVGVGILTPPTWATLFMPTLLACVPLVAARRDPLG